MLVWGQLTLASLVLFNGLLFPTQRSIVVNHGGCQLLDTCLIMLHYFSNSGLSVIAPLSLPCLSVSVWFLVFIPMKTCELTGGWSSQNVVFASFTWFPRGLLAFLLFFGGLAPSILKFSAGWWDFGACKLDIFGPTPLQIQDGAWLRPWGCFVSYPGTPICSAGVWLVGDKAICGPHWTWDISTTNMQMNPPPVPVPLLVIGRL